MKINDIIFRFSFPDNRPRDGICRVRTFVNADFKVFALITDLDTKNPSASITNSIEVICRSLIDRLIVPKQTVFIEHYEHQPFKGHTFDIVTISNQKETNWDPITLEDITKLLDCTEEELTYSTLNNKVLLSEIEKLRSIIAPHLDLPMQVKSDYLLRHFEIQEKMISKHSLLELVNNNSIETEFLKLLKSDLSLFAEIYASPHDNYICFSEFPLNGGYVDFVLFTGVSRMDVFLIEIKGAEFHILNQGSYKKFNAKIDVAVEQIRSRLGYIHRNMFEFREFVHEVREKAISGVPVYNAFIGPDKTTLVNKNKDINIHCIVIGGESLNDLEESHKRQNYESSFTPPIKIESWNSFIRKLRRN